MQDVFYAYILKSKQFDYYYKGHFSDLFKSLDQHNAGMTKSIRPCLPFEIVYYEQFETLQEAVEREKYFKTSRGRKYIKGKLGL